MYPPYKNGSVPKALFFRFFISHKIKHQADHDRDHQIRHRSEDIGTFRDHGRPQQIQQVIYGNKDRNA